MQNTYNKISHNAKKFAAFLRRDEGTRKRSSGAKMRAKKNAQRA
jgi:hypothetical protein